jgi:hypothetical protein
MRKDILIIQGLDGRARHSVRAVPHISNNGAQRTDAPYLFGFRHSSFFSHD